MYLGGGGALGVQAACRQKRKKPIPKPPDAKGPKTPVPKKKDDTLAASEAESPMASSDKKRKLQKRSSDADAYRAIGHRFDSVPNLGSLRNAQGESIVQVVKDRQSEMHGERQYMSTKEWGAIWNDFALDHDMSEDLPEAPLGQVGNVDLMVALDLAHWPIAATLPAMSQGDCRCSCPRAMS